MQNDLTLESWGRFPAALHSGEIVPRSIDEVRNSMRSVDASLLPRGMGRSYGDSCLNDGGYLLSTKRLDKFMHFAPDTGVLRCESGVTLDEILRVFVPQGWFLPVTPGTKYVTIGGAIANDIHGKNHHREGTFSNHVIRFELERSDGTRFLCSRDENRDWFRATVGGIGLTGVILWAELKLRPIAGPYIEMESIKFDSLDEFFQISHSSGGLFEYTVSWLDCLSSNDVRGLFMRGNHIDKEEKAELKITHKTSQWKTFPCDAPSYLLSTPSIKLFNFIYYNKQLNKIKKSIVHYDPFFYPLDSINHWNRMYGKSGFLQWQCAVPVNDNYEAIRLILRKIHKSGLGSFLVVFKEFGNHPSEGMLSFPMSGITLAMDFPNREKKIFSFLDRLDEVVVDVRGRIYPAKDARMSRNTFRASFPSVNEFTSYIDPKFSSSFYRRVGG
ncbi:MAG: FAD-binding oxidoreductase [Nitrospiraceae bacterium]|nr:MAG: FAD-binding oxidoreductase [Nitrospiraceae bacterium]